MRKPITIICLIAFIALQYGKVVSYWHCKLTAPVNCDCQKTVLAGHTEKDHATIPIAIAREKAEEVYLAYAYIIQLPEIITANNCQQSGYRSLMPADHTTSIFQPPRM